ncbi:hypothetical protein [Streptomyces sp. NPDC056987]|uniref:hypothetical protein n=1 Tax=Streptomyces sp. NPDC056987 TaxID=3345988 RepID=UPI003637A695
MFFTAVLLTIALVVVIALLASVAAAKLARLDGVGYPAALKQAAVTFAAVLTLAAAITTALTSLSS